MRVLATLLVPLALAAPSPTPRWAPLHTSNFTLRVPAGESRTIDFSVPARLAAGERQITFTWQIVKPVPAPKFIFMEQCVDPERCNRSIMPPTGQAGGTLQSIFRVVNMGRLEVDVQIRYALWDAR